MLVNSSLLHPLPVAGTPGPLRRTGLSGTVYGVLANDPALVAALGEAVNQPPYKAPPHAPVLYLKPRNTLAASGQRVVLPAGEDGFEVGACLGLVVGRTACRVSPGAAMSHIDALVAVADLSLPHASYYRPSLRFKARDGSCLVGAPAPCAAAGNPDALSVRVWVDGHMAQAATTGGRTRGAARLLSDVSDFMTLRPGDVLLLGASHGAPIVRAGQRFVVEIEGLEPLQGEVVGPEEGA
jgi:5-oxopent-3-ene-1,2,5-tricarboxylate decarboxylase / 2-hydroxyhepta-2,4-diene-1,7-dioate isomerase